MLKFIDENDFSLVERWEQNDDGSVQWWFENSNGVIREGFTRTDENGDPVDVWAILQAKIAANTVFVEQKSQAEIEAEQVEEFKRNRQAQLDSAVVTTQAGNQYDADEISINRMTFALIAATGELDSVSVEWSLADTPTGFMTTVTLGDLREAQKLATQNMANIWAAE